MSSPESHQPSKSSRVQPILATFEFRVPPCDSRFRRFCGNIPCIKTEVSTAITKLESAFAEVAKFEIQLYGGWIGPFSPGHLRRYHKWKIIDYRTPCRALGGEVVPLIDALDGSYLQALFAEKGNISRSGSRSDIESLGLAIVLALLLVGLVQVPWALLLVGAAAFYLMPTLNAVLSKHPHREWIAALNVSLGWTCLGWCAVLLWSTSRTRKGSRSGRLVQSRAHDL